jgi:AcrR family transcriptional regulator
MATHPKPRLSRPERKAQTRSRILQSAARVFAREGFHAASVDTVAEAAGFSKGAVYSNFATKDDLFLALVDEEMGRWSEALDGLAGPDFAVAYLQQFDRDRALLLAEFVLYAARRPKLRKALDAGLVARRADLLRRWQDTGSPPPYAADVVVALADGLALHRLLAGPRAAPTSLAAELASVTKALGGRPRRNVPRRNVLPGGPARR